MKDSKKEYTAPALTVVTFKSERGYAMSSIKLWETVDAEEYNQVEDYSTHGTWGSTGESFWS